MEICLSEEGFDECDLLKELEGQSLEEDGR
jgi:hypothetical protein